ncbi:MAG: RagB/SusD family nutrient uptake outer membrane protein [Alistipes sp.]|nr:RagB/SusD family nutrient uptake outer membrane protein [Alistipes sp.]
MKTNKIFRLFLAGFAVAGLAACDLDMYPETTLTDNAFWNTEGDLRGACNRFYQQMNGNNDLGDGFKHDYRSDELRQNGSANSTSDGSRSVPSTAGSWTDAYWRIFIANNILEKGLRANVTEEVRNPYFAEARFFRAYYYFELVKKYGDVPYVTKAFDDTKDPRLDTPRTPREEVIQHCYDDLQFAIEWLPSVDALSAANWGNVTREAALAMIVRIGLYEGTFGKYHALTSDYGAHLKKSIDAAEELIASGKHDLYPDFEKLFQFDGEGRQNKEAVFVKVYGPNGSGASIYHGNCRQMENSVTVTRNMGDLFLYTDGLPREKSLRKVSPETSHDDVFTNRDPRLGMTLYKIGEEAYKGPFDPFGFNNGYNLKKGFDLSEWTTNSKETIDKMIIRYAEVLISYAEALYEYNGSITDEQLDATVNRLRERVGMPAKLSNAFAASNGLDLRDEIRRERTVEFIDENKRYDDIIRWKIAEDVLPVDLIGAKYNSNETSKQRDDLAQFLTDAEGKVNGAVRYDVEDIYVLEFAENRRFDPKKDYLYPVPLKEISLSGGKVTQNPGWGE